jgi:hypothetical protein
LRYERSVWDWCALAFAAATSLTVIVLIVIGW